MLMFIDPFIKTLTTGSGIWNPLIWIIVAVVSLLLLYIIRGFGNKAYKKGTEQTKSFLSGNAEYEKEEMHVKASNVYWGFLEILRWVYRLFDKMHTGNVSDYILWFVVIMAILFLVIGVI